MTLVLDSVHDRIICYAIFLYVLEENGNTISREIEKGMLSDVLIENPGSLSVCQVLMFPSKDDNSLCHDCRVVFLRRVPCIQNPDQTSQPLRQSDLDNVFQQQIVSIARIKTLFFEGQCYFGFL